MAAPPHASNNPPSTTSPSFRIRFIRRVVLPPCPKLLQPSRAGHGNYPAPGPTAKRLQGTALRLLAPLPCDWRTRLSRRSFRPKDGWRRSRPLAGHGKYPARTGVFNPRPQGLTAKRLQGTALPLLGSGLGTLDCQGRRSTVRGSAWRSPPSEAQQQGKGPPPWP